MGNSITHAVGLVNPDDATSSSTKLAAKRRSSSPTTTNYQQRSTYYQQRQQQYTINARKAKTLPIRSSSSGNNNNNSTATATSSSPAAATKRHIFKSQPNSSRNSPTKRPEPPPNGETSRVLFLLYLIHRTWNIVVETMDTRSKRSRRSAAESSTLEKPTTSSVPKPTKYFGDFNVDHCQDFSLTITDLDDVDASSVCCSQYSFCSCSNCYGETPQNVYNSIADDCSTDSIGQQTLSRCESDFSTYYQGSYPPMAPSVCQNSPKLAPHVAAINATNKGGTNIIIGALTTTTATSSSIAQKSNCGSNSINGSMVSYKMSSSENSWPQQGGGVYNKENQRPPVYNPEDYAQSLKKFGKKQSGQNSRSIYDTNGETATTTDEAYKSATLPSKHSDYKSPIPAPLKSESEMSLRQFASITDLLTKLRADLRVSFPSFVQEFIATPSDGISLLLEVLRAIQLTQATNSLQPSSMAQMTMPRNAQAYQRRALLDELACLQCLMISCTRSPEATARLGTTPVGLMPLATSATGQGIRARILALQLLTASCDKHTLGHGSQKAVTAGHTAVSEAMSTLRLRCSEPVRFRLLVGMLNSGGGSGELQAIGVKFVNTFLESAASQQRLYLQAELFQAGFEPAHMAKTISSSSPWLDTLRLEVKRFNELYVDVDKMITQARDADRVRSQMVILERRVQILHEEKTVLTSMERRLQERCAELQREIFRLQGAHNENNFKSLDKQPQALPRLVPPNKQQASEHEDEGISSSETGPSLSPVPILVLPQQTHNSANKPAITKKPQKQQKPTAMKAQDEEDSATIEDVIGELDHIVSEAERQITISKSTTNIDTNNKEQDIVPVNIVPQPPRKARSLAHLVSQAGGSGELDGSEYGLLMLQNHAVGATEQQHAAAAERMQTLHNFFDETDDYHRTTEVVDKPYAIESPDIPEVNANTAAYNASTTRELLDVIMNARQGEDDPTIKAFREAQNHQHHQQHHHHQHQHQHQPSAPMKKSQTMQPPAQQFNGVFFMTGMNTPQKYPKPDLTAALQAKRVTKNLERLEAAFASHESLNEMGLNVSHNKTDVAPPVVLREKSKSNQQIYFGMRLEGGNNNNNNSTGCLQQQQQTIHTVTAAQVLQLNKNNSSSNNNNIHNHQPISTRTRSFTQGSKVTDIISGLY